MKNPFIKWTLIFGAASLISCDSEVQCPGFGSEDFVEYAGRFESYGEQLQLISNSSDTLNYQLNLSYTKPYTCTSSYQKECECDLRKHLSASNQNFYLYINAMSFEEVADMVISINGFNTRFFLYKNSEPEIGVTHGYQYFSTDTMINQRTYAQVVVGHYHEDNSETYIVLAKEEGLVAYKDSEGKVCYRKF